jgi:hypothetical protein
MMVMMASDSLAQSSDENKMVRCGTVLHFILSVFVIRLGHRLAALSFHTDSSETGYLVRGQNNLEENKINPFPR